MQTVPFTMPRLIFSGLSTLLPMVRKLLLRRVRAAYAALVRDLPDIHRDPFDRLLIAQALWEPLRLITADIHLGAYTDPVIAVWK